MVPDPQELRNLMDESTFDSPYKTPENISAGGEDEGSVSARVNLEVTSSSNPAHPRTQRAGYDEENFILTVEFPDGTLWNYYDVPPSMWQEFYYAFSKGRILKETGLDNWHSMGPTKSQTWSRKRGTVSYQELMGKIKAGKGKGAKLVDETSIQIGRGQEPNY